MKPTASLQVATAVYDRRSLLPPTWVAAMDRRHRTAVVIAVALQFAHILCAAEKQVNLLAIGDWGADTPAQDAVADAMAKYVDARHVPLDAVLLLGDNFYTKLAGGSKDREWKNLFELMYDPKRLAVPFFAILGNHDHEEGKAPAELEYSRANPTSRFKLPGHWYRVDLPTEHPLVTLIGLDSTYERMDNTDWELQGRWLDRELAKPRESAWTICMAHYPLFSDSKHGDNPKIQKLWGDALKKHNVDFYFAGHDHALEHLEILGWSTSFVVSGGGGQELYKIERHDRGVFAASEHGFVHAQLTAAKARVAFINKEGKTLHIFERDRQGVVKVIAP